MSTVLFSVENHVATITLNRPEALNALNYELRQELAEAWKRIKEDEDIRVGILTGAGRAFCAGVDVKETVRRLEGVQQQPAGGEGPGSSLYALDIYKPLIAAINGPAAGGGLGLALCCDILIAAEGTVFSAPFVARGAFEQNTITLLMKKAPPGWAMYIALSATRFDAETALRIALINEIVPKDDLMGRAYEIAERIVANSYIAVLAVKEKMRLVMDGTLRDALAAEGPRARNFREANESKEGFGAFSEKRQAQFG